MIDRARKAATGAAVLMALSGCATYRPAPLPAEDGLFLDAPSLISSLSSSAQVVLDDGLDMNEAAVIAVALNPAMVAERERLGVAEAQLFATRLLPDPQLAYAVDHPTTEGPGLVDGRSLTMDYDLMALLTRGPAIQAQRLAREQVRLDLVWQEWQVAQQARLLFVRERTQAAKLALLTRAVRNLERRAEASSRALANGDMRIDSAGPDLTALLDAASQRYHLLQQQARTSHELHALLGLTPDASLDLETLEPAPAPAALNAAAILPAVILTRPDLLALQAGTPRQRSPPCGTWAPIAASRSSAPLRTASSRRCWSAPAIASPPIRRRCFSPARRVSSFGSASSRKTRATFRNRARWS